MSEQQTEKRPLGTTRRRLLLGGGVAALTAAALASQWFNAFAQTGDVALSVQDAFSAAQSGDILLIDIRRPDEWARTGVGQGAVPLDMRRADFIEALSTELAGDVSRPVALICARGVRSRRMGQRLAEAGFARILDVPEGMLGSGAGPGWLNSGLPVVQVN